MAESVGAKATQRFLTSRAPGNCLLPGIPDDITFGLVIPKLSWRDFLVLSSVSRDWLYAIRSHQVHQARVRSQSTDTLVLFSFTRSHDTNVIGVYSKSEKSFYALLAILDVDKGIPDRCRSISVEGKVYVLGGSQWYRARQEVYVFDVVGQRRWKQCASMKEPRASFGCGVMDGKIYVFGGNSTGVPSPVPSSASEVYDPKEDTWSAINPGNYKRIGHTVESIGGELFLHKGLSTSASFPSMDDRDDDRRKLKREVYHPAKDEWRALENGEWLENREWWSRSPDAIFVARGKFHSLRYRDGQFHIDVYNEDEKSSTNLYSFSLDFIGSRIRRRNFVSISHLAVVFVDDELLVTVVSSLSLAGRKAYDFGVFQSRGFGTGNKEITWQKEEFSGFLKTLRGNFVKRDFMYSVLV